MKTDELREKYLEFFESKGCVRRPSDVLVPQWDPSVLFTPAGMNQFKDHFLGRCKLDFTRATTCQKCLRTGDIDNVGRTAYHHTFFEMLGNFSFGDYFKREAINWAWDFLTDKKWLGMDPQRLSATIYLDDEEAFNIWRDDIKLPTQRIERIGEAENFWPASAPSKGPDGVCGPCSEIYYHTDFGEVEIWNLVFTQFNRVGDPPDNLRPLPSKNIDTGMGLERCAAVLQGVDTNYHIDIFRPLVEAAAEVCSRTYDPKTEDSRRMRRIADHVRACSFAIHENVYPGPNKEKYVVKRLLRRAVLDGRQMGVREPFLYKLVGKVADLMGDPYPELRETVERVAGVIEKEESNFLATIDTGLDRIDGVFKQMKSERRGMVPGAEAADMYTTHGFPPELFETLAAEHNLTFDWAGYQAEMDKHGVESGGGQKIELFKADPLEALKKAMHASKFLGYENHAVDDAKVMGILAGGHLCDKADEIDREHPIVVVLDKTSFYGEMGGQVGDRGELSGEGFRFEVTDTRVDGDLILHVGHLLEGHVALGQIVSATVDRSRRDGICRAHSATHILHQALRKLLGKHAQQQGSKVDNDVLRFDFTHTSGLSREELGQVENEINERIVDCEPIDWTNMPLNEARVSGATMLFGEKYPDVVRVVTMGNFSKELCGGTHLTNTGKVGLLKIVSEESIASGIRRITALTGRAALESVRKTQQTLAKIASVLKVPAEETAERVEALAKEVRRLKKKAAAEAPSDTATPEELLKKAVDISGVKVVISEVPGAGPQVLRQLIDHMRRKTAPLAVMLGAEQSEGKVILMAGFSRDLIERGLSAVDWMGPAAKIVGGGGGGRPDMAQAGGRLPEKLSDALKMAQSDMEKLL